MDKTENIIDYINSYLADNSGETAGESGSEGESDIYLTDLIDVPTLQMIQDAFSNMTGMAALTADKTGMAVTEGSNFTDFCMKHVRKSSKGKSYCELCDKYGAVITNKTGKAAAYFCHAGLMDFAAPILLNGTMIGSFIGGQTLTEEVSQENIRSIAKNIEVNEKALYDAALQVSIRPQEEIERSAHFLQEIAGFLSEMAYGSYLARKANNDIRRAAAMKTDFLANMSHEIRTPMNAVIGMAEMALREELDDTSRSYIEQIKASGTALLSIINDILDYSKIESGKMEIILEDYEPMSIINDMSNMALESMPASGVELVLDIGPTVPMTLSGDDLRIKQVIVNLVSNAVKFTRKGQIKLGLYCEKVTDSDIMLKYSVMDTGVGIKDEDVDNLFTSFQQLDSKRNRNSEGTGLGLVIAKNLATLMGGGLEVDSVYGEGSTFSLVIPQKVVKAPEVRIRNRERIRAYGLFGSVYQGRQFEKDGEALGVWHKVIADKYELFDCVPDPNTFLFLDKKYFDEEVREFVDNNPVLTAVVLIDYNAPDEKQSVTNAITIRKPLYSLNEAHIYNNEAQNITKVRSVASGEFDFIIPDARLLIVDDNAINITVAEGLIEPLKAQIDRALSGQEALDKIKENGGYDLVFMDHMMPGMDGVETTRRIRSDFPELKDMPIIALTANAFSEVRDEFTSCGMNDFIAKPIEVRVLKQKLKQYLPPEFIKKEDATANAPRSDKKTTSLLIGDLDVTAAIRMLGSEKLFMKVLGDYYSVIERKAKAISEFYETEDWPAYTIEVHALKSASRQIGANELADMAMELEKAGHENDIALIRAETMEMLDKYLSYLPVLSPLFEKEEEEVERSEASAEDILPLLDELKAALDELDTDAMESIHERLKGFSFSKAGEGLVTIMGEAIDSFDMDGVSSAAESLRSLF